MPPLSVSPRAWEPGCTRQVSRIAWIATRFARLKNTAPGQKAPPPVTPQRKTQTKTMTPAATAWAASARYGSPPSSVAPLRIGARRPKLAMDGSLPADGPATLADQRDQRRQGDPAHDRRVEQHRRGEPEPELLELEQAQCGVREEHGDHHQRGTGHDA